MFCMFASVFPRKAAKRWNSDSEFLAFFNLLVSNVRGSYFSFGYYCHDFSRSIISSVFNAAAPNTLGPKCTADKVFAFHTFLLQ